MAEFSIGNRLIGDKHPPVVIAEIGINHEGSLDVAIEISDAAINSGAEIIKHQTHIPDDEMSVEARSKIPGNSSDSIYRIMERCALSEDEEFILMQHIKSKGAIFLSTPFSRLAVDRLEKFNVPAYKIGSGECNNYPLLQYIASKGRPVILSTGMNNIESISKSVKILRGARIPFALLHCTNIYPTPFNLVRINALKVLKKNFPDAVIGLSDHSINNNPCLGSVALGASILERHFTDSKLRLGPDILCSMDPVELKSLINGAFEIFQAMGTEEKQSVEEERVTINFAFSSVVATRDIFPGESLNQDNIWVKRPSGGDFTAEQYYQLIGCKALNRIANNTQIRREDIIELF